VTEARTEVLLPRIRLIERATKLAIDAELRPISLSDDVLWTHWHGHLDKDAPDAGWEWDRFISLALTMPERLAAYAVEAEGELQGMALLELSADVDDHIETCGTHLFRLSTAPWNRRPERRYWGVGSTLVAATILRSQEDGHDGRIYCEPLPEAEAFYENSGMEPFDGRCEEGLQRYRFTREGALAFLLKMRQKGLIHG